MDNMTHDFVLVGGGLQNGLAALAILERAPEARIALIERDERLGGNHTWCFHADDVPDEAGAIVGPLVVHRWLGYEVRFPNLFRSLPSPYAAITSDRFDQVVRARIADAANADLILGATATEVSATEVRLADGRTISGRAVIDARGPTDGRENAGTGFQTFVGLELELEPGSPMPEHPVLMDATVSQDNGFRFFYLLPLGGRRLLIEETFFTDGPEIDSARARRAIFDYARDHGYAIAGVHREESGVLPLPWKGPLPRPGSGPLVAGYGGGWFHPVTGYSFPAALKLALLIADSGPDALFSPALHELAAHHRTQMRFGYRLNRMLFNWFTPDQRYNVLERFYRLPEPLIRRFYALELSATDRARIVVGRPPRGISWKAALSLGGAR
jgi:lycopene beta-cyclase